jgi:hypothetical protein
VERKNLNNIPIKDAALTTEKPEAFDDEGT